MLTDGDDVKVSNAEAAKGSALEAPSESDLGHEESDGKSAQVKPDLSQQKHLP